MPKTISSRTYRSGFIFFARHDSFKETFDRGIFGLAAHKEDIASHIEPGNTALFLFDMTYRFLHGVYEAVEPAGIDLDPNYLKKGGSGGGGGSPFPVQVRFEKVMDLPPLDEKKFCHLVTYNHGTNIFRHRTMQNDTSALLRLMAKPEDAPKDNVLPYETNGYKRVPENPRFREQRRAIYGPDA